jgi:hypothetical protein
LPRWRAGADVEVTDRRAALDYDEVAAWQASRNKNHTKADWQFTTADARINLKRLYPAL